MIEIEFQRLDGFDPEVALPSRESALAAGMDLRANFHDQRDMTLARGAYRLVSTGFAMALPPGYEAQIRPRSGLALKHGVSVLNSPGTVDADYRGHVGVILINHGDAPFIVAHGMRIAQMVVQAVVPYTTTMVDHLDATPRGVGGFGSTGLK